jgi:hypothetical protein
VTLRLKQSLFVSLVVTLIQEAHRRGFELTFGECYRSPEEAARLAKLGLGIKNSLHTKRLAIDLNLFRDGKYLSSTESFRQLGEFWESLHPSCAWGGRFNDGGHFSLEHEGRR